MENLEERGSGRTTKQMKNAKLNALFINTHVGYSKELAQKLGREDLDIKPLSILNTTYAFQGQRFTEIIIDHAVILTNKQQENLDYAYVSVR